MKAVRIIFAILALVGASFAVSVSLSAPISGTTVSSPVAFKASASSSNPITGWRIYVDGTSAYSGGAVTSIAPAVTMTNGTHSIIVRAWDSTGAYGSYNLSLSVGTAAAPSPSPTPTTGVTVTVASPGNGSTVASPATINANASSSYAITGWHIYVDGVNAYSGGATTSISAPVNMTTGTHSVIVRAWNTSGAYGSATMSLSVGAAAVPNPTPTPTPAPAPAPTPNPSPSTGFVSYPSTAVVLNNLETAKWTSCNCGGTGSTPKSESLSQGGTNVIESVTGNSSGIAGWLWYAPFSSTNARNWIMDYDVTPMNLTGAVALEFDGNQTGTLGNFVFGTECNYGYNPSRNTVWRFWTMSGGSQTWGTTAYACPVTQVGHTYHVQMYFTVGSGNYNVARVKVTDKTTGAVVQDLSNLGTYSAVGSHGNSIDIQADVTANNTISARYENVTIVRW